MPYSSTLGPWFATLPMQTYVSSTSSTTVPVRCAGSLNSNNLYATNPQITAIAATNIVTQ